MIAPPDAIPGQRVVGEARLLRHELAWPIELPDGRRAVLAQLVPELAADLALRDAVDPAARDALDRELAELVEHAALAASRLDQLEAALSPDDLRSDDETRRASWRVRDRWAARILQVTAFLDAMRARAAMARARIAAQADLDELRGHVAALAEIQAEPA